MMCRKFVMVAMVLISAAMMAASTRAQGPAHGRVEPARDEALEVQAKHNLDVAKWYLEKRKAYEGARDRLQEILDAYPDFSRSDEVLFLLGEIHVKMEKRDKATEYFSKLLKEYPNSEFAKRAQTRLDELKADPR